MIRGRERKRVLRILISGTAVDMVKNFRAYNYQVGGSDRRKVLRILIAGIGRDVVRY